MNKKELRKVFKLKRSLISKTELISLSTAILDNVISLQLRDKKISLFLTIENQNEINTLQILKELEISNQIYASRSDFMFGIRFNSFIIVGLNPYSSGICKESDSPSSGKPPINKVSNSGSKKRVKKVAL